MAPDAGWHPTADPLRHARRSRSHRSQLPEQDMHVSSTFSGAGNTIAENIATAERIGLTELACVEQVRADTTWIPAYVAAVQEAGEQTAIVLHCAVEARILDAYGCLDLPPELEGIDAVYAVSHHAPSPDGPMSPRSTRERIGEGRLDPRMVLRWLVDGTAAALGHHEHVVIAHLFSVLAELGLEEGDVPLDLVGGLALAAAEAGAQIEVNEGWRYPTMRTLGPFLRHGAPCC